MADFNISAATKAMDLLKQYPWLKDELVKMNSAFKAIDNPVTKALLKNATLKDVASKLNVNEAEVLKTVTDLIKNHK